MNTKNIQNYTLNIPIAEEPKTKQKRNIATNKNKVQSLQEKQNYAGMILEKLDRNDNSTLHENTLSKSK